MNIKRLKYFVQVAEQKNITKAAKLLHISQPPLSQQLKLLEEEVGASLMERSQQGITLTYSGEKLYHRAKAIIAHCENTLRELQDINSGADGFLRIGITSSSSAVLLPYIISDFSQKYPRVKYELYEKNTYDLLNLLNNKLIELAFVRTPFDGISSFNNVQLKKERLYAVGHKKFLNQYEGVELPISFFKGKPIIVYRRWLPILRDFFNSYNIMPHYHCINEDARTSLTWALSGCGIAIIPKSITEFQNMTDMFCLPIKELTLVSTIIAIWHKESYISPILQNFISFMMKRK